MQDFFATFRLPGQRSSLCLTTTRLLGRSVSSLNIFHLRVWRNMAHGWSYSPMTAVIMAHTAMHVSELKSISSTVILFYRIYKNKTQMTRQSNNVHITMAYQYSFHRYHTVTVLLYEITWGKVTFLYPPQKIVGKKYFRTFMLFIIISSLYAQNILPPSSLHFR